MIILVVVESDQIDYYQLSSNEREYNGRTSTDYDTGLHASLAESVSQRAQENIEMSNWSTPACY